LFHSRPNARAFTHPLQTFLDGHLLCADEGLDSSPDSEINIITSHKVAEVHLGASLGHPDHALQMTDGDWVRSSRERFTTQVGVETRHAILIELLQLGSDVVAGVHDILAQHVLWDDVLVQARRDTGFVLVLVESWVRAQVGADDEASKHLVLDRVDSVLDDAEHIETRQNRLGQLDVLRKGDGLVVALKEENQGASVQGKQCERYENAHSSDWVGSCDDGASRL
jgi:hypothetical protein